MALAPRMSKYGEGMLYWVETKVGGSHSMLGLLLRLKKDIYVYIEMICIYIYKGLRF